MNDILIPPISYLGTKKNHVDLFQHLIPKLWNKNCYIEPFLGSGVLFLNLPVTPEKLILNDINENVINFYYILSKISLKNISGDVLKHLQFCEKNNSKEFYIESCKKFYSISDYAKIISIFIYLSKMSFFSVLTKKKNNELYGAYRKSNIDPDAIVQKLILIKKKLIDFNLELFSTDYKDVLLKSKKGDFIVLDPPYVNTKKTRYGNNIDLDEFIAMLKYLDDKGCFVLVFNVKNSSLIHKLKHHFIQINTNIHTKIKSDSDSEIILINYLIN